MLHFLFLIKSQGGLINTIVIQETFRVKEGTNAGAQSLAKAVGSANLHLGMPVSNVAHTDKSVTVTAGNQEFVGKRLVLTGSPIGLRKITFSPPLPVERTRLLEGMYMANTERYSLVYPAPFWVKENLTGIIVDADVSDPMPYVFDATPPTGSPGVLQFWLFGDRVAQVEEMPEPQRAEFLSSFLKPFLGPAALNYTSHVYHDFISDPYIGGGFSAGFPPGLWTQSRTSLNATVGPISWAGSEWTHDHFSSIEGALTSAKHAAQAVLSSLHQL